MIYFWYFWLVCSALTVVLSVISRGSKLAQIAKDFSTLQKVAVWTLGIVLSFTVSLMFGPVGLLVEIAYVQRLESK